MARATRTGATRTAAKTTLPTESATRYGEMTIRSTFIALLAATALLAGYTAGASDEVLDVAAWKERLDATPGALVLDVRTPQEHADGHIPGSMLLPYTDIGARSAGLPEDKSAPIFVYCRSGNRAGIASGTLHDLGYTNVIQMDGGFPDWVAMSYPSETGGA